MKFLKKSIKRKMAVRHDILEEIDDIRRSKLAPDPIPDSYISDRILGEDNNWKDIHDTRNANRLIRKLYDEGGVESFIEPVDKFGADYLEETETDLNDKEAVSKKIRDLGYDDEFQTLPSVENESVKDFLKRYREANEGKAENFINIRRIVQELKNRGHLKGKNLVKTLINQNKKIKGLVQLMKELTGHELDESATNAANVYSATIQEFKKKPNQKPVKDDDDYVDLSMTPHELHGLAYRLMQDSLAARRGKPVRKYYNDDEEFESNAPTDEKTRLSFKEYYDQQADEHNLPHSDTLGEVNPKDHNTILKRAVELIQPYAENLDKPKRRKEVREKVKQERDSNPANRRILENQRKQTGKGEGVKARRKREKREKEYLPALQEFTGEKKFKFLKKSIRKKMAVNPEALEDAFELGFNASREHPKLRQEVEEHLKDWKPTEEMINNNIHEDADCVGNTRLHRRVPWTVNESYKKKSEQDDEKYGLEYSSPDPDAKMSKEDYKDTIEVYRQLVKAVKERERNKGV